MGTNWTADLDNPANKKFVSTFTASTTRLPATFAALGYDAVKLIDSRCATWAARSKTRTRCEPHCARQTSSRCAGPFKFNNNHFPIQNLYIMEVKKDEKGQLKAVLKDYGDQGLAGPLSPGMPDEVVSCCWATSLLGCRPRESGDPSCLTPRPLNRSPTHVGCSRHAHLKSRSRVNRENRMRGNDSGGEGPRRGQGKYERLRTR